MRRAFTLVEMMFAASISAIIMVALCMALTSVWREAIKENEEMQILFKASAMRERLLVGTAAAGSKGFHGLLNVTNKVMAKSSGTELYFYNVYRLADGTTEETEDTNERLPGTKSSLVFGKSAAGGKNAVVVSELGSITNEFDYAEIRQRVTVYLWVANSAGTVCRMPVYLTTVREDR